MQHHPRLICHRYKHLLLDAVPRSHTDTGISNLLGQCFSRLLKSKAYAPAAVSWSVGLRFPKIPDISSLFVGSHFMLPLSFCPCRWGMCLPQDFWISSLCQIRDRQTESLVHAREHAEWLTGMDQNSVKIDFKEERAVLKTGRLL